MYVGNPKCFETSFLWQIDFNILKYNSSVVLSAFAESKALTDKLFVDNNLAGYAEEVIPA